MQYKVATKALLPRPPKAPGRPSFLCFTARTRVSLGHRRYPPFLCPCFPQQLAVGVATQHLGLASVIASTPAHSFATLLSELAAIVRNTCRTPGAGADAPTFDLVTTPNAQQQRALELIGQIRL